jgi:exopolysaccharide production protein ExoZ
VSESSRKFYGVQILRAFAALLVVMVHAYDSSAYSVRNGSRFYRPYGLANGSFGVDIFFAISGLVMFLTASSIMRRTGRRHAWKEFIWRRVLRIVPPYYFFTTLKLLLLFLLPGFFAYKKSSLWNIAASYLFLPSINAEGRIAPVLPVGWTLIYEMLFYLVLMLALFAWQPILRFSMAIIIPLALAGFMIPRSWGGLTYLAHPIELEFLFGMLVGVCVKRRYSLPPWTAVSTLILAFIVALSITQGNKTDPNSSMRFLFWGITGALILLSVTSLESIYSFKKHKLLLLMGDSSYVLYLCHIFLVPVVASMVIRLGLTGLTGVVAVVIGGSGLSIAVAIALHLWLERPMLRFLGERRLPWSLTSADSASAVR